MENLLHQVRYKIGNEIRGPVEVGDLRKVQGFTLSTMVAPVNAETWQPAFKTIDLSAYFGSVLIAPGKKTLDRGLEEAVSAFDKRSETIGFVVPNQEPENKPISHDALPNLEIPEAGSSKPREFLNWEAHREK